MKNKIGFNFFFALMAFTLGLALFRELNFETYTFRKTSLGVLYLITFLTALFFTFKKKSPIQ